MTAPTCPPGFAANGVTAGLKPSGKPDLAVVLAREGASAAAMLTTNQVRAAPLVVTARHLSSGANRVRALIVNAGCANAATGTDGERRAQATVEALAARLGCGPEQVLVNSTGVIGVPLPVEKLVGAMDSLVEGAAADGFGRAAEAIMTTDTRMKTAEAIGAGGRFRVVGMAKGAGMIHPDLAPAVPHATMIAVLLTDAQVMPVRLQTLLAETCERSFHRITVDGDTSTNDAVFALASGAAGAVDENEVRSAFAEVARSLAAQIVRDGEGAQRLVRVAVAEAATAADALAVARTVATSLLVRTAIAGGDPNWGRILAAIGRSGATLDLERLVVDADGVRLFEHGAPQPTTAAQRARIFKGDPVTIEIRLGLGTAADEFMTCDLTKGYVEINSEYTT
ncbi:MAG: bifunctional glutamate N-acetyltransferase/amino-acid acetyltransferase ArgJ [Phycisphaerales bacterium]|nr:bifunctional glutamate N-acetyltransferase/amino-acid acetyltransferase ArgJ [Phycisphaerales bacterium]